MNLLDLSNVLVKEGFDDIFNYQIDGEILDLDNMSGSVSNIDGSKIVEFKILNIGDNVDFFDTEIAITCDAGIEVLKWD